MQKLNLNSLRMFDAAARHLNFTKAAQEMNITQGAVADRVRQLEVVLGQALFHRQARGLTFTEAGSSYHAAIEEALNIIDTATAKLSPENKVVTLTVTPSFASKWLVYRLTEFSKIYPEISVEVEASEHPANLKLDGIDFAIRLGHLPFDADLKYHLFSKMELCAVCSKEYAREVSEITRVQDLFGYRLIQDSHYRWDELGKSMKLKPKQGITQFNQTSLGIDAALSGQGITLAPRIFVDDELRKGMLISLWSDEQIETNDYYVLYSKEKRMTLEKKAVLNWLLSEKPT
ncbi:LysR family transcriptional regulator [Amylibacter sp. SFDW26]|uniref:LysR substrate-binding domain-containing protein n=1 Tax=Amylibacter sp. SFDW26 TaxID=2652722 RepID=UPI0012618ED7|nr:LysR substrate-binding domain-containing protein [Amylibacter sp. SFDW26]KAB7613904.1 LysR family transcriptional regulator [Amylibacter sp. SFDW26]